MSAVLADLLADRLGGRWTLQPLGRSAFCATWRAHKDGDAPLFVKSLPAANADVLEAEADGLAALAATGTIRVPAILDPGLDDDQGIAWLALEWLDLTPPDAGFGSRLGAALGALHRAGTAWDGRFGWHRDNWLGATPQRNDPSASGGVHGWCAFNSTQRIGAMRDRLRADGRLDEALDTAIEGAIASMPRLFDDGHEPRPSLIHGDLWSGNWGMLADGTPVLFDPAVSWSDAEAELAMMELFGAPPAAFWPAYSAAAGLHPGYPRRRPLYQLYHLLNHVLLFGGGYERQALAAARGLSS